VAPDYGRFSDRPLVDTRTMLLWAAATTLLNVAAGVLSAKPLANWINGALALGGAFVAGRLYERLKREA